MIKEIKKKKKKWDWKIFWMILSIIFFILWILNVFSNVYETQQFEDLELDCEQSLRSLNNQWQSTLDTVLNCYRNNVPECEYSVPDLKD